VQLHLKVAAQPRAIASNLEITFWELPGRAAEDLALAAAGSSTGNLAAPCEPFAFGRMRCACGKYPVPTLTVPAFAGGCPAASHVARWAGLIMIGCRPLDGVDYDRAVAGCSAPD
jgi:hypothetical protein